MPAATVVFVSGDVKVIGPAGASPNAVGASVVDSGETIETAKGRVQRGIKKGREYTRQEMQIPLEHRVQPHCFSYGDSSVGLQMAVSER